MQQAGELLGRYMQRQLLGSAELHGRRLLRRRDLHGYAAGLPVTWVRALLTRKNDVMPQSASLAQRKPVDTFPLVAANGSRYTTFALVIE